MLIHKNKLGHVIKMILVIATSLQAVEYNVNIGLGGDTRTITILRNDGQSAESMLNRMFQDYGLTGDLCDPTGRKLSREERIDPSVQYSFLITRNCIEELQLALRSEINAASLVNQDPEIKEMLEVMRLQVSGINALPIPYARNVLAHRRDFIGTNLILVRQLYSAYLCLLNEEKTELRHRIQLILPATKQLLDTLRQPM